jgi:hypothetical protein
MLGALVIVGCKPERSDEADLCGASALQDRIGQPVGAFEFDEGTRIIPPNSAVTMDHRVDRLNVELDEAGIIVRIACG